jgi:uncharacterized HAD superfamily protein
MDPLRERKKVVAKLAKKEEEVEKKEEKKREKERAKAEKAYEKKLIFITYEIFFRAQEEQQQQ